MAKILSATFVVILMLTTIALKSVVMAQQPPTSSDTAEATNKLFEAVQKNNISGVRTAIAIGADTAATNEWGITATDLAVEKGYFDIAHFLLSARNMRDQAQTEPPLTPSNQLLPAQPVQKTPPVVEKQATIPTKQVPDKIEESSTQWPADKPNPFDPNTEVAGSRLTIIGKVKEVARRPASPIKKTSGFPSATRTATATTTKSASGNAKYAKQANSANQTSTPVTNPEQPGFFGRIIDSVTPDWFKGDGGNGKTDTTPAPGITQATEQKQVKVDDAQARAKVLAKALAEAQAKAQAQALAKARAKALAEARAKALAKERAKALAKERAKARIIAAESTRTKASDTARVVPDHATDIGKSSPHPKPPKAKTRQTSETVATRKNDHTFNKLSDRLLSGNNSARPDVAKKTKKATTKTLTPPMKQVKTVKTTVPPNNHLSGSEMTIGKSAKLGQPLNPNKMSLIKESRPPRKTTECVSKKHGALTFCIEPVNWPERIKPYFMADSIIYQGAKTVVRYDNGVATFFHTIFPSTSFDVATSYYQSLLGTPSNIWNRSIAPLAEPRRKNPTYVWKSTNPVTKQITTLEIRNFDDARGGFPDTGNGVIMLYGNSSLPIFPEISIVDIMLINSNAP